MTSPSNDAADCLQQLKTIFNQAAADGYPRQWTDIDEGRYDQINNNPGVTDARGLMEVHKLRIFDPAPVGCLGILAQYESAIGFPDRHQVQHITWSLENRGEIYYTFRHDMSWADFVPREGMLRRWGNIKNLLLHPFSPQILQGHFPHPPASLTKESYNVRDD